MPPLSFNPQLSAVLANQRAAVTTGAPPIRKAGAEKIRTPFLSSLCVNFSVNPFIFASFFSLPSGPRKPANSSHFSFYPRFSHLFPTMWLSWFLHLDCLPSCLFILALSSFLSLFPSRYMTVVIWIH